MFTPQQIEEISFSRATFGGYDMQSVDEVLEPLTEDYITLYKENALLKSKMRVLVAKLEEYRQNEASMKDAIVNAQKTCDRMVKDAEAKCTQMLQEANQAAADNAKNAGAIIAQENARVEDAKKEATFRIAEIQAQLKDCIDALQTIKTANRPAQKPVQIDIPVESEEERKTSSLADEISQNLEAAMGTTQEEGPKMEPKHPASDTTSKFSNLQFGRNYDPNHKYE